MKINIIVQRFEALLALLLICFLSPTFAAGKATYLLDRSFKLNKRLFAFSGITNEEQAISKMVIAPDSGIVLIGTFTALAGKKHSRIAKLTPSLQIDAAFNPDINGDIYDIAISIDGKILVGGDFTAVNGIARKGVARLTAAGLLDDSFDPGSGANGSFKNITRVFSFADGSVVVFGSFSRLSTQAAPYSIGKLNADGSVNDVFMTNLATATLRDGTRGFSFPDVCEKLPGDKLLIVGYGTDRALPEAPGFEGSTVINSDGTRTQPIYEANDLKESYIYGRGATTVNGSPTGFVSHAKIDARFTPLNETLYRFTAEGKVDPSFRIQQKIYFNGVTVKSDGSVLIAPQTAKIKTGKRTVYSTNPILLLYDVDGDLATTLKLPQIKNTAFEYKQILPLADGTLLLELRTVMASAKKGTVRSFKHFLLKVKPKR